MANNLLGSISWLSIIGWLTSAIGNKKKVTKNNLIDTLEPLLNNKLSGGSFYFNFY